MEPLIYRGYNMGRKWTVIYQSSFISTFATFGRLLTLFVIQAGHYKMVDVFPFLGSVVSFWIWLSNTEVQSVVVTTVLFIYVIDSKLWWSSLTKLHTNVQILAGAFQAIDMFSLKP